MATYDKGDLIRLQATWKNSAEANVDPSTVILKIQAPSGTITEYTYASGTVQKNGTGVFYYDYLPSTFGNYTYRWEGTGAAIASGQSGFYVEDRLG